MGYFRNISNSFALSPWSFEMWFTNWVKWPFWPDFPFFRPVLDGRNWTKQVLSSFFLFVRKKQVLDEKNNPAWGIFKMAATKKCRKAKSMNFRISTTNYHRYTKFAFSPKYLGVFRWKYDEICQKMLTSHRRVQTPKWLTSLAPRNCL